MTKSNKKRPPSGEIRQSQILSTFGPGSMVDLPDYSILIGGLNHWHGDKKRIYEDRLAGRVAEILNVLDIALYAPPVDQQDPKASRTGITAFTFPTWFLAQVEKTWPDKNDAPPNAKIYRTRPLLPWGSLVGGKYLNSERKKDPVVPVRFVQACVNGHISDIDWYRFVHENSHTNCRGQLWLDEGGAGNDFADIFVRCEGCEARRPLANATIPNGKVLGQCAGDRPWLGPKAQELCLSQATGKPEYNRLLVRSASNAYFSQVLSVISLPDSDAVLRNAVNLVYEDFLQYAESVSDVKKDRKKQKVSTALEGFSDDTVWAEIQRRQSGQRDVPKSIKQVEIETLLSSPFEVGEDVPEGDFYARARSLDNLNPKLRSRIERIILVHRLREVIAQVGFTRFEAAMPDIDGELDIQVRRAALDIEPKWVPAIENKGEGVFIAFRKQAIEDWLQRDAVKRRGQKLARGFDIWRKQKGIAEEKAKFPGLPYIMLHSLSHLLIAAVSLECGYAASSIRERIYAGESGYGILLYTGSSGSEGTLGGLVQVGNRIEYHLDVALELGRLCSNDPVCAQHQPDAEQEDRFLHGAACHGCLLIAETSCERRNEFLDRALVVGTVEGLGAEFFEDQGV
ncbi:MAG: DUF1998 domain-containing protein [Stigonema ocellatum SAG 48.90 = DSM 106950]|nr:DUF1998 domain-containing protein [Stigonema ocellatum SAG 48.90 = DSM 106950]